VRYILAEDNGIELSAIPDSHGFQGRFAPCAVSSKTVSQQMLNGDKSASQRWK
jgi:hypothetical protein